MSAIIRVEKDDKVVYMEWTVIGSGPGMGMMLARFKDYYRDRFGTEGLRTLPERLERADKTNSSSFTHTREDLMRYHYEDEWGHRPISMDELWERYVDGEICAQCGHVRALRDMTKTDVCVYCVKQITPVGWPEVLGIPEDGIGPHGSRLLDIRADPDHPWRETTWSLVQEMYKGYCGRPEFDQAVLDHALEEARRELT